MNYVPFKPIKGQAFSFPVHTSDSVLEASECWVSKNGAKYVNPSTEPVLIQYEGSYPKYNYTVTLTAAEMNYDIIVFSYGTDSQFHDVIYTQSAELAAVPTTASSLSDKITALWQYFFLKRDMTNTTINMYKDDATTALCSSTVTDDGTTVAKGEFS